MSTMKVRRGAAADLPAAEFAVGELGYATDAKAVVIGDGVGKSLVGKVFSGPPEDMAAYEQFAGCLYRRSDTGEMLLRHSGAWVAAGAQPTAKASPDSTAASAAVAGRLRYRETQNASHTEMVMRVGPDAYEWVGILTNTW
jgi:hypothetical protein